MVYEKEKKRRGSKALYYYVGPFRRFSLLRIRLFIKSGEGSLVHLFALHRVQLSEHLKGGSLGFLGILA